MNEFLEGGLWEPDRIKWDHKKIEKHIRDNWKDKSDQELADGLSDMIGKNVTEAKVKEKRLDMGIDRSVYVRKHMDHGNVGKDPVIDWKSPDVIKYVQTRYKDMNDAEMAEGLSERYDEDVTWKMVRQHRLQYGYTRDNPKSKSEPLDLGDYRKYIYEEHPQLNGDRFDTIQDFLVHFHNKLDLNHNIRSLKHRMRDFVKNDAQLRLMKPVNLDHSDLERISEWLGD